MKADDASSECELQALVTTLKEGCENNGLIMNENKTNVLVFERNEKCKIIVNGKILIRTIECSSIIGKYVQ